MGPPRPSASQPGTGTPPPRETQAAWTPWTRGSDRRPGQSPAGRVPAPRTPSSTSGARVMGGHQDQALSPALAPSPGEPPPGGHMERVLRSSGGQEGRESALGRTEGPAVRPRPPPQRQREPQLPQHIPHLDEHWGLNTQRHRQERNGAPLTPPGPPEPCRDVLTPGLPQGAARLRPAPSCMAWAGGPGCAGWPGSVG